ncbi:MAG: phosphatidate cytidylyltransferase [Planctomycetota bacterium]
MLSYRLAMSALLIPMLLAVLWLDQWLGQTAGWAGVMLLLLLAVFTLGASREVAAMMRSKGALMPTPVLAISGQAGLWYLGLVAVLLGPGQWSGQPGPGWAGPWLASGALGMAGLLTVLALVFFGSLTFHCRDRRPEGAILAGAGAVFACVYLGLLPGFWLLVRQEHSAWIVAGAILVTKSCDIGAYTAGRIFGRRKLIKWLSPGKTWEGLAGGLMFSGGLSIGLVAWANAVSDGAATGGWAGEGALAPLWLAGVAGVLLGLVGQLGDLLASLLKRDAKLKDSGATIPGFGGVLDLVDSALLTGPVAYWLLALAATIR